MLKKDDILAIVASELSLADSSTYNGQGNVSLEESLSYYLGQSPGPAPEGRSSINSTDVADSIEWIMPQIMKSFTQNNEVVVFDPVHEGDEKQAEMESEYVYEVLMKQNNGFIVLHQFVKDALMQRNGILKVYYAKIDESKTVDYTGITEQQLQALVQSEGVEIVEKTDYVDENQTESRNQDIQMQMQQAQQQMQMQMQQLQQQAQQNPQAQQQMMQMQQQSQMQMQQMQEQMAQPIMLFDVKLLVERIRGQVYVDPVPPEEFRLNAQHNSICLDNARFTAHVNLMPVSDIIEQYGLSLDETKELPEGATFYDREYRFTMQNESVFYDRVDSGDESQRLIEVSECFLQMDVDETGISKLMKVTVAGGDSPTDIIKIEEIECMPWVATTAILMSHKFQGLSITDRIKEIQDQKTALWRNMMDNMYLQNNQRNVVVENQVNMDDLLVSRPGGIIRAKRLDAIQPLMTPQLGQDAYNMMEYLDKVRAGRTGVDADGSATPANIGDRVGSQGVDRLMNAKEELVGLIIRVVAETGIKPLCVKIRDLSIKHVDSVTDFRFRGQWQQINPSEWSDRTQCTVRVGTGTGDHAAQVGAINQVMMFQEKILMNPAQTMLTEAKVFTALDDFCKFSGLNGAVRYFDDPSSQEAQQRGQQNQEKQQQESQKQDQMEQAMAKSQMDLGTAALQEAKAKQEATQAKMQTDQAKNQLVHMKQEYEAKLSGMKIELDEAKAIADSMGKDADLQFKYDQLDDNIALELTRIEATTNTEQNENFEENRE
jgi:hypothetical protein